MWKSSASLWKETEPVEYERTSSKFALEGLSNDHGAALAPKAQEKKHPGAFYRGLWLVAIDGAQFFVTNTPQILASLSKAASRRLKAAFAKVGAVVLVELGVHNSLAVEIGVDGEGAMTLAKGLLSRLPPTLCSLPTAVMVLALFCASSLWPCKMWHALFRFACVVTSSPAWSRVWPDGSALMEIKAQKGRPAILVREIRGSVCHAKGPWIDVRFWTNLLDPQKYPAAELLGLFAKCWEQEMMCKGLKIDMRQTSLLNSHTPHTAAQEIAALVLAHALVAPTRLEAADVAGTDVLRISFGKALVLVVSLWLTLAAGDGIISKNRPGL